MMLLHNNNIYCSCGKLVNIYNILQHKTEPIHFELLLEKKHQIILLTFISTWLGLTVPVMVAK